MENSAKSVDSKSYRNGMIQILKRCDIDNTEPTGNSAVVQPLTTTELAYLAGFIDGEGAFTVNRRRHSNHISSWVGYSAYLEIGNTDKSIMDWIHDVTGCTSSVYCQKQPNNRRPCYRLRFSGRQSIALTKQLLPYLRVKRLIASKFVTFPLNHRKLDRPYTEALFREMREINKGNGKSHANIEYGESFQVCRDYGPSILGDKDSDIVRSSWKQE